MLHRVNNVSLWITLLVSAAFLIPLDLIFARNELFEFVNLLIIAVAAGTAIGFHPAALDALKLPAHKLSSGQVLVTGLVLASIAIVIIFTGQYVWRAFDRPDQISDNLFLAFGRWLLFISWVMTLIASGSDEGKLPPSTYKRAGIVVFVTIIIAGVILALFDFR